MPRLLEKAADVPPVLTVYLVEDDPLLARHVLDALARADGIHCVGHADRLAQARAELPRCRPQVLLSDLGLPDGDGTELIRELDSSPPSWHPHILVYSVFGDESRVIHAIEAGADGYFLKGCSDPELIHAVQGASHGESPISPAIARYLLKRFASADAGRVLTTQEQAVLKLVAQGYVAEEVAERLGLSPHVVATHVRGIYAKLQTMHRVPVTSLSD
ncbi:response regulator transcription factor [Aquabacterium sp. A7-Y]|uniref:response regulator n=1 Tax=Aquabacterium sp. A7-Y TaxID=1349605 RepID=UPI00223D0784|nr:response regulator transcription factor [Aquabacterium sp. A7-Y]MCW7538848.1 response regulator transcription factor [Aquabacterium sp. A7-Y]